MKRIIGAAVLAVVLAGCRTTGEKITRLDPGSTREQVVAKMGRPDAMRTVDEFEVYTYLERKRTRLSIVHTDYTVILKDGHVVQYGPGLARREGVHSMVIDPPES